MTPREWEDALVDVVGDIDHRFAVQVGGALRGFNLTAVEGGWLLVVRTMSQQRGPLVAFFGGRLPIDCLEQFVATIRTQPGIPWKPDKYAK